MLFTWLLSICTSTCTAEKTANNTRKTGYLHGEEQNEIPVSHSPQIPSG